MQKKRATITREILKGKAHEFWQKLPQYQGLQELAWSNRWLQGFKGRHNIKEYVYHGEASSVEVDRSDRIDEMTRVRAKYNLYPPKDKFNIDESGL